MKDTYFFAVDLGATSGRTILGKVIDQKIELREITRFSNHIIQSCNHFYWDILALYHEILNGLKIISKENIEISSIGIDTWGVDVVFIDKNGEILSNPYSYRDPCTIDSPAQLFKKVSKEKVYGNTGIQIMNFNTLFQLFAQKQRNCQALEASDKILFMPDALSYLLTGNMVTEYTIASTSQMLNANKREFDEELLNEIGISKDKFAPIVFPRHIIGNLSKEVQEITGLSDIPVIAVAGHDTASAVAAVPAKDDHFAYLSSGTWSLMGIENSDAIINENSFKENFTNEGGIQGTIRFLKNICGMWLLERCRAEWEKEHNYSYPELIDAALKAEPFKYIINPDSPCFANPSSMIDAIKSYCKQTSQPVPTTYGEITRCIFESLALRYRQVFTTLTNLSGKEINVLHIIGGGSKNALLNQLTSNALGIEVVAGPSEATAIGNIMIQAMSSGIVSDIKSMRTLIKDSIDTVAYQPEDGELWGKAYDKYLTLFRNDI